MNSTNVNLSGLIHPKLGDYENGNLIFLIFGSLLQVGGVYTFTGCLMVVPVNGSDVAVESRLSTPGRWAIHSHSYKYCFLSFGFEREPVRPSLGSPGGGDLDVILNAMSTDEHLLENLAKSIFPNIHGMHNAKMGIVLQLFGGVEKTTTDKLKQRGNIHCLIVGDSNAAKSTILAIVS